MASLDEFIADVAGSAYGWPESLRFTYDTSRRLLEQSVAGDLVECGVGAGCHPAVMARACMDAGEARTIRLFDSFEGVPHGGVHDVAWNAEWGDGSGRLRPTGVAAHSLQDVIDNIARWGLTGGEAPAMVLLAGWFQETLPLVVEFLEPIAFLRLDGDLYDSTLVCLQHLEPLVTPGGVIVLDDWNLDGCRKAFFDYWDSRAQLPPAVTQITTSGDVWWRKL